MDTARYRDAVIAAMHRVGTFGHLSNEEFEREVAWQFSHLRTSESGRIMWRTFALGRALFDCLGEAQNWRCCYCGLRVFVDRPKRKQHNQPTIDHVTPLSKGGADHPDNMVIACFRCNQELRDVPKEFHVSAARL